MYSKNILRESDFSYNMKTCFYIGGQVQFLQLSITIEIFSLVCSISESIGILHEVNNQVNAILKVSMMKLAYTDLQVMNTLLVVFFVITVLKFPVIGMYCESKFSLPTMWVLSNEVFLCIRLSSSQE